MSAKTEKIVLPPDAARLAVGMRDMGYSFESAISDLVDNSISAGARNIRIQVETIFPNQLRVFIADDGCGMSSQELQGAMKYGAAENSGANPLNKFGLGLKTASSSFSKRFSVVSRKSASSPTAKATWDIDQIVAANEWILEMSEAEEDLVELLSSCTSGSGTLVLWENIDRLLTEKQQSDDLKVRKAIISRVKDLSSHLSLVFQRYLDPENPFGVSDTVKIFVNGNQIGPRDPFCVDEKDTLKLYDKDLEVELPNGRNGIVKVRGYILPRKESLVTQQAKDNAAISNDNQGIYIYRQNRLIHGPDWQGIYGSEPHYSLARVEFSFEHDLDDIFEVDVQKSRIILEADIRDFLQNFVLKQIRSVAVQRYRDGQIAGAGKKSKSLHGSANSSLRDVEEDATSLKIVTQNPETGEATIENRNGVATIRLLKPEEANREQPYIVPEESLRDGVFWEPVINESRKAVAISTSHPFYNRIYLPAKQKEVVIQSFDYLLWALAMGEMNTMNDKVRSFYEQLRIDVSRQLRLLSESLPEAEDE